VNKRSTTARPELAVRGVALAVAAQVWPLLLFASLILAAALLWAAVSGDTAQLPVAAWIFTAATAGLTTSFALHECLHAAALKRITTVTAVTLERTWGRISLVPHGSMTGWQAATVAASGPLGCILAGALLALHEATRTLSWWYLGHAVFLLPVFGDGIALTKGLLAGPTRLEAPPMSQR
jgi:hypothetical protein